jgi:(p)ppGpp synthase/HD superfamily hydrolase
MAALLHDVLEDTNYNEQDLLGLGYSQAVVSMCSWLNFDHSRYAGMTYMEKIQHLKDNAPDGAVKVKLADNGHNSDESRGFSDKEKHAGMMKRYSKAKAILSK